MRIRNISADKVYFCVLIILLLLPAGGCGPNAEEQSAAEIREVLQDFYKALGRFDLDDLDELTEDPLAEVIDDAGGSSIVQSILKKYAELDIKVSDIDIDDSEAEATVLLRSDDIEMEQIVKLDKKGDVWKVAEMRQWSGSSMMYSPGCGPSWKT